MPTPTQGPRATARRRTTAECSKDTTPPPTPQIAMAYAFERAAKDATFRRHPPAAPPRPARVDPVYLELNEIEPGTKLQLINLSKDPAATFKDDAVELSYTGRSVFERTGAVYLTERKLKALDLRPGDAFALRAVDEAGNVSDAEARGLLDPDGWAYGLIDEPRKNGAVVTTRGAPISALDGEDQRKEILAKAVADGRPPVVLDERITFKDGTHGAATLHGDRALEPGAQLEVVNLRTSESYSGQVDGATGALSISLANMRAGDPIVLRPTDARGVVGEELRLTYAPKCRGGKSKARAPYASRLAGVL